MSPRDNDRYITTPARSCAKLTLILRVSFERYQPITPRIQPRTQGMRDFLLTHIHLFHKRVRKGKSINP